MQVRICVVPLDAPSTIEHDRSDHLGAAADSVGTPLQYLEQNRCLFYYDETKLVEQGMAAALRYSEQFSS